MVAPVHCRHHWRQQNPSDGTSANITARLSASPPELPGWHRSTRSARIAARIKSCNPAAHIRQDLTAARTDHAARRGVCGGTSPCPRWSQRPLPGPPGGVSSLSCDPASRGAAGRARRLPALPGPRCLSLAPAPGLSTAWIASALLPRTDVPGHHGGKRPACRGTWPLRVDPGRVSWNCRHAAHWTCWARRAGSISSSPVIQGGKEEWLGRAIAALAPHGMLIVDDMTGAPQWDTERHAQAAAGTPGAADQPAAHLRRTPPPDPGSSTPAPATPKDVSGYPPRMPSDRSGEPTTNRHPQHRPDSPATFPSTWLARRDPARQTGAAGQRLNVS